MGQIRRSGPATGRPDTNSPVATVQQQDRPWWDAAAEHWTDVEAWWTDVRLAYAAGLADGSRIERERIVAENEELHRAAVHSAIATIERADRRAAADRWGLAR